MAETAERRRDSSCSKEPSIRIVRHWHCRATTLVPGTPVPLIVLGPYGATLENWALAAQHTRWSGEN